MRSWCNEVPIQLAIFSYTRPICLVVVMMLRNANYVDDDNVGQWQLSHKIVPSSKSRHIPSSRPEHLAAWLLPAVCR